ncbi:malonate--CoA ligase [Pelagibius marinus]|uniref:malonate--CoA ligase n=1 Tax=Pelagibius marinus TaxID=2762760 RepID=UPI001872CD20|nr:malonyl-CoA synthase [Pelagibius marinus]
MTNLYTKLTENFPADRGKTVLETPEGRTMSYADFEVGSGRIARLLVDCGVQPGDRVAAQIDKSPEALLLYLAVLRCGGVYLPLNTAYKGGEVAYFLGDAEPRVLVCDPQAEDSLTETAKQAGTEVVLTLGGDGAGSLIERSRDLDPEVGVVAREPDDLAAILYTSGTTGRSKGAMLSHDNLGSNTLTLRDYWGFTADDVLIHALPIFHTHGLFVATHCVLLSGARMLFLNRFDADTVIDLLPRATAMMGVPTFYTRLLANPRLTKEVCAGIRLFVSGSAPLLADTFQEFEARTGHRILERYGMTETTMSTSNPLDGERIAGTVGHPLPGVEARIADEAGNPLPQGEVGILEVKGPNVFKGYWRNPEKTAEEFRPDGFFITGDLATIDARGYVQIVGRSKDLIISGGFNVYPKEIELCIDGIEGVDESAVIGLPHPDFGEAVVAVVKRQNGGPEVSAEAIQETAKAELANFKVPKKVFFVDELPRNTMGKVQKNTLRDRFKDSFSSAA